MRITKINPFAVHVGSRNQLLLKVESDDGFYGWGESGLSGREHAVVGAIEHYSERLIGRDPTRIGAIWQELYRSQYFEGGRVLAAAISAIDIALHDLVARSMGVPVYRLLGGRQRDFVPCFATVSAREESALVAGARLLIEKGWKAIRAAIPPGPKGNEHRYEPRESIPLAASMLTALRDAVGSEPVIGIDYHHRLSVAEAASFCQRLAPGTLDFLEEPIRAETPEAYEALRRLVDVPFAIGEEFASKWDFLPYIERGITQFARVDVCNVGGLTEAMKVAALAEAHYVDLMPHNPLGPICTAASIHLAAAVPNFSWLEVRVSPTEEAGGRYRDDLFKQQPRLDGSSFPVGDAPGLGIEVDEAVLETLQFEPWDPPTLRRDDGSLTNW